jgi:glycerophosphoryl diester phosphodiesterase
VSRLGRRNPVTRLRATIRGLIDPPPQRGSPLPETWVIGHRGAARVAPENTIASFERALELGADGIETDICVTRDGHFVLWHDANPAGKVALVRQAGREELFAVPDVPNLFSRWRRPVRKLTLSEFRSHYGYSPRESLLEDLFDGDSAARFPVVLLEELLSWAKDRPRLRHICLDIKLEPRERESARRLFQRLREFWEKGGREGLTLHLLSPQRAIVEAFLAEERSGACPGRVGIFADFELPGVLDIARRLGVPRVSMGLGARLWPGFLREAADVASARARGDLEALVLWTINDEERLRRLVGLGVDGVLTDDPALLRRLLEQTQAPGARPAMSRLT